jgi:hypothetical protein
MLTGPRYTGEVITGGTVSGLLKDFMHAEGYIDFSICWQLGLYCERLRWLKGC